MTLQEAYKQAIEMPIKDLPNVEIRLGTTKLIISYNGDKLYLCNHEDANECDNDVLLIETHQLLSNDWYVEVGGK